MANPAELLHDALLRWNLAPDNRPQVHVSQKPTPAKHRQLTTNHDYALREHEITLGYIAEIRELLDTYEYVTGTNADEFRRELPNWTAMVLSYDNGWGQVKLFDDNSLRWLKTLGPMLAPLVPRYSDDDIANVGKSLMELLEILTQEETIDSDLKVYLLTLINHIKWVLVDVKIQGEFKLDRAVNLLRESVRTAEDASTDDELKPRYNLLSKLLRRKDAVVKTLEMGTAAAKALDAVQKALPPGTLGA